MGLAQGLQGERASRGLGSEDGCGEMGCEQEAVWSALSRATAACSHASAAAEGVARWPLPSLTLALRICSVGSENPWELVIR